MSEGVRTERPSAQEETRRDGLKPTFTPLGIWAFSIGTSIGWGSLIVTCNTYLLKSGILGTALGLAIGMGIIFVITWNLQAMICKAPDAGGIYTFEKHVGGHDFGFLAFWFVLLTYLAILCANMTSLPLFARFFLGETFQFGFHYQIFGYEVWMGEALLSMCAVALIGLLCARSTRAPNAVMSVAAPVFTAGFVLCAVVVVLRHESGFSYTPYYVEGSSALGQIVRIAVISPWAFIGFENVAHFSEEYAFPVRRIRRILVWSVLFTTLLYLLVSLLSISAYPPEYDSWLAYIQDMGNLEGLKAVPAFYVVQHYLGMPGVVILMLALFAVILTSLIGNLLALSRLLFAAGREGEAPQALAELNGRGIPHKAIYAVIGMSILVPFLGRTAIGWIVDVTTLCASIIYGLISHAVFLSARRDGQRREVWTGALGMVLMAVFVLLLLIPGLLPFQAMETESYFLFIAWALLGLAYFRYLARRDRGRTYAQSPVVWIVLLMLVLFASMMWVSRATEQAADEAAERIFQYHQEHPGTDTGELAPEARENFLHEQAQHVSQTNTLYTMVSIMLMGVSTVIMVDNYREKRQLGQQLDVAEHEAQAAKEIAELKESINVLFDNMPVMSYSKDSETGVYIACNQSFAEYAHKETPEQVVGLADYEIFGEEIAERFAVNDRLALQMDHPYVFFEDVADAVGNPRQFQTTKLKFTDPSGRLCLLGMSLDMTEMERAKRESAEARAAYQDALTTSSVYESIIDSLAEDYFNLFYVDLETEDYIEYGSRTEEGRRTVESRGKDFFTASRENARHFIYWEDQPAFIAAMDKEFLVGEIRAHGTFIMQYRLQIDGRPTYVNLKATFASGDQRHMIIGVNNIDAQVRERAAAQKTREEMRAFARLSALNGNMIVLYFIDPQTSAYTEYSATQGFEQLGISKRGDDFFASTYQNSFRTIHPDDLELFHARITRENILGAIERDGVFALDYRLVGEGLPAHVRFKAAMVVEDGRPMLIVGLLDEDARVAREREYERTLNEAQLLATRDGLTGVKNKHAYVEAENELNELIAEEQAEAFGIAVCDINDLKAVNDTQGHAAGDRLIREACSVICTSFKRSPVFRIGGDEFAVICRGHDYEHAEEILAQIEAANDAGKEAGGVQIACGYARLAEGDYAVEKVFERADRRMYERKAQMKDGQDNVR